MIDRDRFDRVEGLRIRARDVGEAVVSGMHTSRYQGASVVFADHREYSPGDDPRTLDVRAWARTDRPVVRRFEHEARLSTTLLLDASASMAFRSATTLPSKHEHAATLLGGLAYVLLRQGDAVAARRFDVEERDASPTVARLTSLEAVLTVLEPPPRESARTDVARALEAALPHLPRRSWVALASDAIVRGSPLDGLRAYSAAGLRTVFFHVVDPAERDFPFRGPAEFRGLEGEKPLTTDASSARDAYLAAFARHAGALRDACSHAGARYVLAATDEAPERTLADLLAGGPL